MNVLYILLAYFSLFALGLIDNSRGPVYPEVLKQFNITQASGSIIFSISSLFSFLISLVSGFWLKRWGTIKATKFALALHFTAAMLMGISGKYDDGFYAFILACCLFGTGIGLMSISLNLVIADAVPLMKRSKYFAGLHSMYGLASLIAPTAMGIVFHYNLSWQNFFMFLSGVPLIILIFAIAKVKNESGKAEEDKHKTDIKLPRKLMFKLGIAISFYVATEMLIASRLVFYVNEFWHYELDQASSFLSIYFLLLLAGRLFFSFFTVPVKAINLLKGSLLVTIIFYLLGMYVHPYFLVAAGLSMSFFFPTSMDYISVKYEEFSESLISKVMIFVGGMLVSMHWFFGLISSAYGMQVSMFMGAFMLIVSLYLLQTEKS